MSLGSAPIPTSPRDAVRTTALWQGVAGLALLGAYWGARSLLPASGAAEFAYAPDTPVFHLFAHMRGFTLEQLVEHALRIAVLGPALALSSLSLSRVVGAQHDPLASARRIALHACALSLCLTSFVMLFVLRGRPITDDEVTYAAMAQTLARGSLADPRLPGMTLVLFDIATRLGISGKYLFGEPLVQVLGSLVGVPALLHVPLNALTLRAVFVGTRLFCADEALAWWSTTLLALSPMFILCAATGHSQAASLTCAALGVLGYALASRRGLVRGGVLAGFATAFGLTVRPQAAAPIGLALACAFTLLAVRRRAVGAWLAFAATSLTGVVAVCAYAFLLSGDPLKLPWFLHAPPEHYGFGPVFGPGTYEHTLGDALLNLLVVAVRLDAWWLGFPLSLALLFQRRALRPVREAMPVLLAVSVAIVVFELGYYTTGISDVGPVYHHELLLLLSVVAGSFVVNLAREHPRPAVAALAVYLTLGTGTFLLEQTSRLGRLVQTIHGESDRVVAALPKPALLLHEVRCSETLPAGWVHRAYPAVVRDPKAPVVIYARPEPASLDRFLAHFPDRACYYVRRAPDDGVLRATPCDRARDLLLRPLWPEPPEPCRFVPSTAERVGLYDPRTVRPP